MNYELEKVEAQQTSTLGIVLGIGSGNRCQRGSNHVGIRQIAKNMLPLYRFFFKATFNWTHRNREQSDSYQELGAGEDWGDVVEGHKLTTKR